MYIFPSDVLSLLKLRVAIDSTCSVISVPLSLTQTTLGVYLRPLMFFLAVQMNLLFSPAILMFLIATVLNLSTASAAGTEISKKLHVIFIQSFSYLPLAFMVKLCSATSSMFLVTLQMYTKPCTLSLTGVKCKSSCCFIVSETMTVSLFVSHSILSVAVSLRQVMVTLLPTV